MKPSKTVVVLLAILIAIVGLNYVRVSLRRAAAPLEAGAPPDMSHAPVRLYGVVEPLGREAFIGPSAPGRVVQILAREGQAVKRGAPLVVLDNQVETQAIEAARSRAEEARRRLEITQDDLRRKRRLAEGEAIPEFDKTRLELQVRLEEQQVKTALADLESRQAELERLTLRAPLDGLVYKLDVRLGEQLLPQDYARIVVGPAEKQVRVFVEAFWRGKVAQGQAYRLRDTETGSEIGTGTVREILPYVGSRDFRTDDALERLDVKYAQAILVLDAAPDVPIGLLVMCEQTASPARAESRTE